MLNPALASRRKKSKARIKRGDIKTRNKDCMKHSGPRTHFSYIMNSFFRHHSAPSTGTINPFGLRTLFARLAVLMWLLLFVCRSDAQTFTTGRIGYGDGSANVFSACALGPDGKFYAFWQDGNFVHSVSQTMPRIQLVRWEPGTSSWTELSTILVNTIPNMYVNVPPEAYTMVYDRVGLKIDSQGTFHAVLRLQLTTTGETIVYARSTNGTSWTYTNVEADNNVVNYSFSEVQLELDQNERPHIVFRISNVGSGGVSSRVYSIRHQYFNGTSWVGETVYSQTGGTGSGANEITVADFGMDSAGKVHVAFAAELNGSGTDASLLYMNNKSGTWSTPLNLAQGNTGASACNSVALVVDANDKVHILRRDLNYNLYHHTDKSGSWVNGQINGNLQGNLDNSSLTINGNGDLLTFYNAQTGAVNSGVVRYAVLFNGTSTWQTGSVFTGGSNTGRYPGVSFKDSREAMFLFDHFSGSGSPSYGPPNNPRELEFATATINPPGPNAPTVTTTAAASITATSATLGGTVTSDGGGTVTERGIVWATTANPTVANNKVANGSGTGGFSATVSGLPASTLIYVRAYASNSGGTGYGSQISFTTAAANTAPTLNVNTGLTLNEGQLAPLSAAALDFDDAEQSDHAITYTVTALPVNGGLLLNGAPLVLNGTFTQANLNNGALRYAHNGSETTSDSFSFSVSDGVGGNVAGQSFHFTINPINDLLALAANPTITFSSTPGGAFALDGQAGANDVEGLALEVYFADASRNRINNPVTFEDPYGAGTANSGLAINYNNSAGSHYVIIKSQFAGDNFWLQALQLTDYGGNNVKIEAFDNGVSQGSVNVVVNATPWYFTFDQFGALLPAIFRNADEIRISAQNGDIIWLTINDIKLAPPVSNNAPTDLSLSNHSVNQSAGVNAIVGTLTTTDADAGDSHSYTFVTGSGSTDNGLFNLSGATLRVNDASALTAGNYSVRIQTDDGNGGTFAKALQITIVDDVPPVIISGNNAQGTNGASFTYTITATGGATGFNVIGSLPTGLTVNPLSGEISGLPTQAGSFNVSIIATDLAGNSVTNSLSLSIAKALGSVALNDLSQSYNASARAVSVTTTPNGLTVLLTYNGSPSAPTNAGTYEVVGIITDANYSGSSTNSLVITKAALTVSADNATRAYGSLNPAFTGSINGVVAGDDLTPGFSTAAHQYSFSGQYDIVPFVYDPTGKLGNYNVTANNGTLTVTPLPLVLTVESLSTAGVIDRARVTAEAERLRPYDILVSTNLMDWSVLTTVPASAAGLLEFIDAELPQEPMRFFRARMQ